ncbi:N-formylglutamate amidohydrolase [Ponticoccus alexandrii]|uniref:N-formylglutamate amidohydrolase n=1 Tax=Ponticoccus alexandrii TaxID=1943633 RepID=A0ABX7FFP9_9RHOB|nr:N-formylglutamate amidohydrolase [Ponticoccus alexandrii]ETA49406.1 N-formylglutamate amidohydrolase [Rhodobacteraceae bacterium PD-2]QRF69335.1 N-formylglutamate amidohydrolase [Ponticoccus alexandrii]
MREPFEILNPEGRFPGLIVVDHAGVAVPEGHALGLAPEWHGTHHFCDLGVEPLARMLAARLDAPVILGTVSRLVLDLNRWIADPRSIATAVEGVPIPGNVLTEAGREARRDAIFWPYHAALNKLWQQVQARHADPLFLALHTCTRVMDGQRRPWDAGTIWNESPALSQALLAGLEGCGTLGDNQPYTGRAGVFTVDRHTWGTGRRACGLEVSNDLVETRSGQEGWADRLTAALHQTARTEARA